MTIDYWTLGIQTVNVVILVLLLRHFFWRPVAGIILARHKAAHDILDQAEARDNQANAALAEIEKTRAGFQKERETILSKAHESAAMHAAAQLQTAKSEAKALLNAAHAERERDREAAERALSDRAILLGVDIAARLAARLEGQCVREFFLDGLIEQVEAMPESARRSVADSVAVDVVSSKPLGSADQAIVRMRLGTAFGREPALTFRTDPALIEGFEIRGPHFVVRNNWRADLDRIREDLARDR